MRGLRNGLVGLGVVTASLVLAAAPAFALDCSNVSRPAPAEPASPVADFSGQGGPVIYVVQGDWWYISFDGVFADSIWDKVPPGTAASVLHLTPAEVAALGLPAGTVNGNYQAGTGIGLLDNAQAPCNANRQTTNGIQAGSTRCGLVGP
jgi:hypothetical protein